MTRALLAGDPPWVQSDKYQFMNSPWPAKWIGAQLQPPGAAVVWAFRRKFSLQKPAKLRIHVSADQRYRLYVDGKPVGQGPERGDLRHWMYESYDVEFAAGAHSLVALVWWLDPMGPTPCPWAQMTQRPGFWLCGENCGQLLDTGVADWQATNVQGMSFQLAKAGGHFTAVGCRQTVDAEKYPWGIESGDGENWQPVVTLQPAAAAALVWESATYWLLRPAMLPAMRDEPIENILVRHIDTPVDASSDAQSGLAPVRAVADLAGEHAAWSALLAQQCAITIPAGARRRVILDLQNYACAYPRLCVSGGAGASIRLAWAESLYLFDPAIESSTDAVVRKGNRNEIEGRVFVGYGDALLADGGQQRTLNPLWWGAGRYVEILIHTGGQPLVISSLELRRTGYPYQYCGSFTASDPRLERVIAPALRTLEQCSHETSMDCPYYEQLNYAGDTRLQSLVALTMSQDDRLVRKSLKLFDWSRTGDTWTHSRYPTSMAQTIPTFALCWAGMVHDYAMYRGDREMILSLMPGVRAVMERWRNQIGRDGLVRLPAGWNFVDWTIGWHSGMPTGTIGAACGVTQWQVIYTMNLMAKLEQMLGEEHLAKRHLQTAGELAEAARRNFWDGQRGMFANDDARNRFSEHAQALALLSGQLAPQEASSVAASLIEPPANLEAATIYFSHYIFSALAQIGRGDALLGRMGLWFDLSKLGFTTLPEAPEPARSDCHAWGAHPLYHYFASILGITPDGFGFSRLRVRPQLGPLQWAAGRMAHPAGMIELDVRRENQILRGTLVVPQAVKQWTIEAARPESISTVQTGETLRVQFEI